jgi:glycosyltransferase involved in cell wall biosynthesis
MKPEVSVIIPSYNRRLMLREAAASVIAQCGVLWELIIVDDGSTDGTFEDLNSGELARLVSSAPSGCRIFVERTPRRGPAAARNRGAALAAAEHIAFLDSDDLWDARKLARQLDYIRAHPEYPLVQTQELWIRNGRRVNPGRRHLKRAGDIFEPSLHLCLISCSAVMMTSALFKESGGFDERMAACEDYDLWLRMLCRHEAGLLDEPLVTRRGGHRDQLSARPALDRFRIRTLLKLLAACSLDARRQLEVAAVLAEKCAIYANGLKRRGRLAEFHLCSELGDAAQSWLVDGTRPEAGFWRRALDIWPV